VANGRLDNTQWTAIDRVDVAAGGNISGISLALRPGSEINGQIYVDGQTPEGFQASSLRVQLQSADELPGVGNVQAQVSQDGSFVLRDVAPGARYRVRMTNIPSGGYLLAARVGGENPLSQPVAMQGGVPLQLQIGFAAGRIEASVMELDKPVSGIVTVLVPNDRGRIDLYRTANSAKDGKVAFANIPPGDYKLFAWEEVKTGAWQDPIYMEAFEDKGRPIHVDKAGALTETIQVIKSEGY
jgi:hypothetical protein